MIGLRWPTIPSASETNEHLHRTDGRVSPAHLMARRAPLDTAVYAFLSERLRRGEDVEEIPLPEDRLARPPSLASGGARIAFAPGASEGLGERGRLAREPAHAANAELGRRILVGASAAGGTLDNLMDAVERAPLDVAGLRAWLVEHCLDLSALRAVGRRLAVEGTRRLQVKVGLLLLGLARPSSPADTDVARTLACHGSFTQLALDVIGDDEQAVWASPARCTAGAASRRSSGSPTPVTRPSAGGSSARGTATALRRWSPPRSPPEPAGSPTASQPPQSTAQCWPGPATSSPTSSGPTLWSASTA